MRRLLTTIALGVALTAALLGAPSASAFLTWPQREGDDCTATGTNAAQTAIVLNNDQTDAALPINAPPEVPAVITKWKVNAPAGIGPLPEQLIATHQVAEEADQLVGESSLETIVGGASNEFLTRIPVTEYDHVGLRGPDGALVCAESLHLAGLVAEPWPMGESRHFHIEVNLGVPVVATLEPDRDHDGYGDETQDGCPRLAAVHTACPFVRYRPHTKVFRRGILLEVNTDDPTTVAVTGQVAWHTRPPAGEKSKRLIAGLSGGTQSVGKEATVGFWVPLPKPLLVRLATLPRAKELKARLTAVVTDVAGEQTEHKSTVTLHGALPDHRAGRRQGAASAAATLRG